MSERKFWSLMIGAAILITAVILTIGALSGWDTGSTECVHIGDNPCVPVVHNS